MSQLYSRVFLQILDSSIAEDFTTRHVFEDFLKLADHQTGIVDVTRQALSRRLNIPITILNEHIAKLESPDPASRDQENDGRRIQRMDEHRDWGWIILNWSKYDEIRTRADAAIRMARSRSKAAGTLLEKASMAEQIYEAYPLKVGKPAAMRAISKALVKVDGDWLLNVTKAFAVARAGDMAFCPHPATWFNAERYNDSPGTWVRDAAAPVQRSLGYIPDATGV